jgi:DNA-binding response OmpR family regulator
MASSLQEFLGRRPSVLIVDDDEDLLLVLQLTLAAKGFNVIPSINAQRIFELLESAQPDIVLLDITMNGVSGGDICTQIKQNDTTSHFPVLMFSANRNVAEIAAACHADGYVSKPFEVQVLAETLAGLIKTRSV